MRELKGVSLWFFIERVAVMLCCVVLIFVYVVCCGFLGVSLLEGEGGG